jgi:xanthine dehydrogenase accessory factor
VSASPQAEFAAIAAAEGRAAVVTVVGGEDAEIGAKILVRDDGSTSGSLGSTGLDAVATELGTSLMWAERSELHEHQGMQLFVDAAAPAPRLIIFGAVDYTTALCRLARAAGWRPIVCDPRSQFATRERFPDAEAVIQAWPEAAFEQVGIDRATYVAVLTHDPKLDDSALGIALRSEAAYVGAMGSRRAQERRRERLIEKGFHEDELDRLAAPIGLDLGATGPEETALSIMAEVVAVRNGREGGRLRDKQGGRIHEVGDRAQPAEPAASREAGA